MTPAEMTAAMRKSGLSHRHLAELSGVRQDLVRSFERGDAVHAREVTKIKSSLTMLGIKFP